jgi:putative transposase
VAASSRLVLQPGIKGAAESCLLDAGPYTFVAADALVLTVRESGGVVDVHALVATRGNADGHREIRGPQVASAEGSAGWLAFFRHRTARGFTGIQLVNSAAYAGLGAAIEATLPGTTWQRRTHYAANLMAVSPKNAWTWVRALLHSVYDRPDATSVHAQFDVTSVHDRFDRVLDAWPAGRRAWRSTSSPPAPTWWLSPPPVEVVRQIRSNDPASGSTGISAGAATWSASSPTVTS